jgi:ribosomal protein L11 methyltransferase
MDFRAVTIDISKAVKEELEILIALLNSINYEGITEEEETLVAYISADLFNKGLLEETLHDIEDSLHSKIISIESVKERNWNKEWETNFEPVIIDNRCVIRAPFHEPFDNMQYVITIEPKMAFGTGHHETTSLMVSAILDMDVKNKTILDMGCGTGVLGILSAMRGAKEIIAIDNDGWAFENTKENARINNVEIAVLNGSAEKIPEIKFDIVLANITRNVLIEHATEYAQALDFCGKLFLSGFLEEDVVLLEATYSELGLTAVNHTSLGAWQMLEFVK